VRRALALAAVLAAVAGCGGSSGGAAEDVDVPEPTAEPTRAASAEDVVRGLGRNGFDPAAIYDREAQGVVTVVSVFGGGGLDSLLQGGGEGDGQGGIGSGFVLNERGEIATNAHVVTTGEGDQIKAARQLFVQFGDGNRVEAKLRGFDPNADVALIEVDPEGLELDPLPLGDSDDVQVGSPVAAMGSPFGEEQSLSVGVVSAVDRDIQSLTSFSIGNAIQTDAAINPGNSGGPLVNAKGEVIGLNQQIKTNSGGGEGVGFALPSNLAKRSIDQLRDKGKVDYAYLGVTSTSVYPQVADKFGLPVKEGAWLQEVPNDGPGAKAGLRGGGEDQVQFQAVTFNPGGDVIVQVGRTKIRTSSDLSDAIAPYQPGDRVPIVFYRGGERRTTTVTVAARPLAPPPGG
jgi:2-alkenal reductase